ncbi:FecR family protein [Mucilaginibacter sp. OK098]|uniref:FecR family protein n=1 Tax=Mucilaginibacter sp. OK098 TaxID=1855297 RepID=UPI00091B4BE5|nr:FecR family protein [Mucilaginibacter sp. OK098]SHM52192.1 FecR family protein [Mucilaginibacter sp. OK098]
MSITRLEYLFQLCINNDATPEQREEMLELMALPENESIAEKLLHKAYEAPKQTEDLDSEKSDAILNAIYNADKIESAPRLFPRRKQFVKWAAAAAAVFVFFFSAAYFFIYKKQQEQLIAVANKNKIIPGRNKATLTLADGSKIDLDDAKTGGIAKQAQLRVTKTAAGQLIYTIANTDKTLSETTDKPSYNTIETPVGGQYQVILSDGTRVWLNAASSLKYPTQFATGERQVELTGEGYFEVTKNKAKPFKVITDRQEIEVLGTHFNVNAYTDENAITTTLLEGSVKIAAHLKNQLAQQSIILKPGQQSILGCAGLAVGNVNTEDVVAWKNGYFSFNEDFESIMRRLSRWYNIDVVYKIDKDPDLSFGGKISRSKSINSVLNIIEATGNVHFKIEGRRIIVTK